MARKTTKPNNLMTAIDEAISTPVDIAFNEATLALGIGEAELRERLEAKLDTSDVHSWDLIPVEHQSALDGIKRDIESEASVRQLAPEVKPIPESPTTDDIPLNEETPTPAVKPKRKRSTALTKKKSEALAQSQQEQQKLAYSEAQIFQLQHARKGQKDGAQLAVIEHEARQATYSQVKAHLLTREIAQLSAEIAAEQDFNPTEILAELGIEPASDIYEDLRSQIEPMLGKLTQSVEEIVETSLLNGVELDTEFTRLEKLLSSNNS